MSYCSLPGHLVSIKSVGMSLGECGTDRTILCPDLQNTIVYEINISQRTSIGIVL